MKLNVIMLDRWRTEISVIHEGQAVPHGKRLVQVELTPEQVALLTPRETGISCGQPRYEEYGDLWFQGE